MVRTGRKVGRKKATTVRRRNAQGAGTTRPGRKAKATKRTPEKIATTRKASAAIQPNVYAIKADRTEANPLLPEETVILLGGERSGRLIILLGWSSEPDRHPFSRARIVRNLERLQREWDEEIGPGWRLEVRP